MSDVVISIEHVSKLYRLGLINHGTLYRDLQSWWARLRNLPDPNSPLDPNWASAGREPAADKWFSALNDVSFEVKQGEVIGLVGGNGAGKSTLLKVLSRITTPTAGSVALRGRLASLLEVGTGFHPELTGRENVFLNGALLGMRSEEVRRKFDEIVDFSGVESFIDTPVKRYSSGMYVRLAFAVAAHLESEILLIDEVLAVGDAAFQKKCLGKMEDIGASGRTIVFVSHNMAAIENLCNRVIVLEKGQVGFSGPASAAINHYYSSIEKRFEFAEANLSRQGDGRARIRNLWVTDTAGSPLQVVRSGTSVNINIEIERKDLNRNDLALSIGITTLKGEGVLHFSTETKGVTIEAQSERIILVCSVSKWNIRSGIYGLNVYLTVAGMVSDWIQDGIRIQVEDGDFYGTGRLPPEGYSNTLSEYDWLLSSQEPKPPTATLP
jgi:lipopolysaccharide transport system ATP-binding protein